MNKDKRIDLESQEYIGLIQLARKQKPGLQPSREDFGIEFEMEDKEKNIEALLYGRINV